METTAMHGGSGYSAEARSDWDTLAAGIERADRRKSCAETAAMAPSAAAGEVPQWADYMIEVRFSDDGQNWGESRSYPVSEEPDIRVEARFMQRRLQRPATADPDHIGWTVYDFSLGQIGGMIAVGPTKH